MCCIDLLPAAACDSTVLSDRGRGGPWSLMSVPLSAKPNSARNPTASTNTTNYNEPVGSMTSSSACVITSISANPFAAQFAVKSVC